MKVYFAVSSKLIKMDGLVGCIGWASKLIENRKAKIVKIVQGRPNEKEGRIVFEVTKEGAIGTPNGRIVNLSVLKKGKLDA